MSNLRDLRARKKTVQATRKITSAMKMIAAAKLRKAQKRAQDARPYAQHMSSLIEDLRTAQTVGRDRSLLTGAAGGTSHLVVVTASNRGLCGGFNTQIVREARKLIRREIQAGFVVKIICVGKRARDQLKGEFGDLILETYDAKDTPAFFEAARLSQQIVSLFEQKAFDRCTLFYNKFISALVFEPRNMSLIPFEHMDERAPSDKAAHEVHTHGTSLYEYEPSQEAVLEELLPRNLSVQLYRALLENAASEQGARMTAMDGATRNAGDMIHNLDLVINRTRQAHITRELVEIIAGAEAV